MHETQDKIDEEKKEKGEKEMEELKKALGSHQSRILKLTTPKILIFVGIFFSLCLGSMMPLYAIIMNNLIFGLSMFMQSLQKVRENADFYCLLMFILAIACYCVAFVQKFTFGYISENVTLKIRIQLYQKILGLHNAWFDQKENSPGQLSTILSKDTATINGVGSESLAAQIEGVCTLLMSVVLGFIFSWRLSLICLGCIPLTMIGAAASIKFQKRLAEGSDDIVKEANVLAGDAILNYRTVASFGNADQVIA